MRRRFRGLCLLLFLAGVAICLAGAAGVRIDGNFMAGAADEGTEPNHRGAVGLGLALQVVGVAGYLGVVTLWPRRAR